jgi:hypothetical protein
MELSPKLAVVAFAGALSLAVLSCSGGNQAADLSRHDSAILGTGGSGAGGTGTQDTTAATGGATSIGSGGIGAGGSGTGGAASASGATGHDAAIGTGDASIGGTTGTGGAGTDGRALGGAPTTGGTTGPGGATETGAADAGGLGTGGRATGGSTGKGGSTGTGGASTGGATGTGGTTKVANPTIWIAGDSTVMTYAAGNTDGNNGVSIEGWGQEIGQYFNASVTINNQAIGGRSVAYFMWAVMTDSSGAYVCDSQGAPTFKLDASNNHIDNSQWARIKSGIKAGDFLLIQFGTNDETHTCPRYVSLTDFETDFGFMADTVVAKGATPIFVTPMGHRTFSGTTVTNTLLPYANAMKNEATQKSIEVEDLNLRSMEYYQSVGTTYLATNIFDGGTTHFIKAGAVKMAELIVGEVKKNNGPLAAYLK